MRLPDDKGNRDLRRRSLVILLADDKENQDLRRRSLVILLAEEYGIRPGEAPVCA